MSNILNKHINLTSLTCFLLAAIQCEHRYTLRFELDNFATILTCLFKDKAWACAALVTSVQEAYDDGQMKACVGTSLDISSHAALKLALLLSSKLALLLSSSSSLPWTDMASYVDPEKINEILDLIINNKFTKISNRAQATSYW